MTDEIEDLINALGDARDLVKRHQYVDDLAFFMQRLHDAKEALTEAKKARPEADRHVSEAMHVDYRKLQVAQEIFRLVGLHDLPVKIKLQ